MLAIPTVAIPGSSLRRTKEQGSALAGAWRRASHNRGYNPVPGSNPPALWEGCPPISGTWLRQSAPHKTGTVLPSFGLSAPTNRGVFPHKGGDILGNPHANHALARTSNPLLYVGVVFFQEKTTPQTALEPSQRLISRNGANADRQGAIFKDDHDDAMRAAGAAAVQADVSPTTIVGIS